MNKVTLQVSALVFTFMATLVMFFDGATHFYFAIIAIAAVFAILSIGGK